MKKLLVITILMAAFILSACQGDVSESTMQTAVAQVVLTSSAEEPEQEPPPDSEPPAAGITNEEFEAVNSQLKSANLALTEQAAQLEELSSELEGVYLLLTPTATPTPQDTPTPTITPTRTPTSPPTEVVMPWYHKYVEAVENAPLYYFDDENDAGFPIMLKTSPVIRIPKGEEFIVNVNRVRADGGAYYYLIVGPKNEGYYVSISDVENIE